MIFTFTLRQVQADFLSPMKELLSYYYNFKTEIQSKDGNQETEDKYLQELGSQKNRI